MLLVTAVSLVGCAPSPGADAATDRTAPSSPDAVVGRGSACLHFDVVDDVSASVITNARITVNAEIGREVATFSGGDYATMSGCTGMFVVTVEAPGYERYEWTYRAFRDRDFATNQEFQRIEIRLRPLSDGGPSDAAGRG
ncbi:MAG: hypothetical protein JNK05_26620 [Myxococcales bacterium]|nr:hypothetical protein [Myxococcales bacterium]